SWPVKRIVWSGVAALIFCSSPASPQTSAAPSGATIGRSGFASIAQAPPSPWPEKPRPTVIGGHGGGPSVTPAVRPLLRIFAHSDRALGATNQALLGGRIVLRDGCLFVTGRNQPDRLAYFAHEVAVGFDGQGYLSLRTRGPRPQHLGRIGEQFSWGGPIGASEALPMVARLRQHCGTAPLEHVGIPQSARLFQIRSWVIDSIATRHRISRDRAWQRFKACVEQREAGGRRMFDCDMI
ncbi:MAG: hypothetical protein ABIT68_02555, partial [Sphingomicrobium sp.]